jgi:hypothetical protein
MTRNGNLLQTHGTVATLAAKASSVIPKESSSEAVLPFEIVENEASILP